MAIRIVSLILVFLLGILGGYLGRDYISIEFVGKGVSVKETPQKASQEVKERKPLFYRNPMNPAITSPVPAKDEMGMDYIPVYPEDLEGGGSKTPGTVTIDPVTMQNMGVRTKKAECMRLSKVINAYGTIVPDEDTLFMVHTKFKGWVEDIRAKETGEFVRKGEVLLYVYSPEVVTAQDELLMAIKNLEALGNFSGKTLQRQAERLVQAARKRLLLLGVPGWFVAKVEKGNKAKRLVPVEVPASGIITAVKVRPKAYVTPKTTLYEIADLRTVWCLASFFEDDLPWVKVGDPVELSIKGMPGKVVRGRIDFVYPTVDPKTRTVKTRIRLRNPGLTLRPGMYASVTLRAQKGERVLVVPREAILRTGKQGHVFVALGGGKFEPRPVTLGIEAEGLVEIKSGLEHGEEVVVSGQFLIDSESSIKEAAMKMMEPGGTGNKMTHSGQEMKMPPGAAHGEKGDTAKDTHK